MAITPAIDAMPTPTDRIFLVLSIGSSQKFAPKDLYYAGPVFDLVTFFLAQTTPHPMVV
jgi:hypothetical protein